MTASASSGCCVQYRTARYQPRTTPRTAPGWALMTSRRITNTSTMSPGVVLAHVDRPEVLFGHAVLPEEHAEEEVRHRALVEGHALPPQVLDRLDALLGHDPVPALAVVETEHGLELQRGLPVQAHRVQGGHQA